jgi:hypothetical protein
MSFLHSLTFDISWVYVNDVALIQFSGVTWYWPACSFDAGKKERSVLIVYVGQKYLWINPFSAQTGNRHSDSNWIYPLQSRYLYFKPNWRFRLYMVSRSSSPVICARLFIAVSSHSDLQYQFTTGDDNETRELLMATRSDIDPAVIDELYLRGFWPSQMRTSFVNMRAKRSDYYSAGPNRSWWV